MKITWVTRSFLDYRIPIYQEINRLCGNQLTVIYFKDVVPLRCQEKLQKIIGDRAIGLTGEIRLSGKKNQPLSSLKKNKIRIPIQRGLIKKLRKTNPEVMIGDGFFQWSYVLLWLRFWKRIPLVICYEGTNYTERNTHFIRTLYRTLAVRWIDRICCNGIQSAEYIVSLGYPNDRISLGNMTVDTVSLQKKSKEYLMSDKIKLKKELKLNNRGVSFCR
jgi:hypothetical protein